MSATDELRRLLDERGVEWWQSANTLGCVFTRWHSPLFGDEVCAMENGEEGLVLFDHFVTPEQAIDATLGPGTCHFEQIPEALYDDIECSECGVALWGFQMDIAGEGCPTRPRYCPNCGRAVVE